MALPVLSDQAEAFVVFARELSFTEAARQLRISQPALHAKIGRFQQAVELPLYEKHRGELRLTTTGRELARFIEGLRRRRDCFAPLLHRERPVTLAAGEGSFLYLLGPAVEELLHARPGLSLLTADADRCLAALVAGEADIAVGVFPSVPADLVQAQLALAQPMVACLPDHEFVVERRTEVSVRDLDGQRFVLPPVGRPVRDGLVAALEVEGVAVDVVAEARGWEVILKFVTMGAGCGLVNSCVAGHREDVCFVPVTGLSPVPYTAVRRASSDKDPAVLAAFDVIERHAHVHSQRGVR